MVFLNPLASTLKVWMVFFFVLNILFKSIWALCAVTLPHHAEIDLNKKLSTKKKDLQTFKVDAKGFRKTMN